MQLSVELTMAAGSATTPSTCSSCACCFGILVDVTGYDIWRLSRSLALTPSAFVELCPSEETDDDIGVMFEPGGNTYTLVLRRQPTEACTFLMGPIGATDSVGATNPVDTTDTTSHAAVVGTTAGFFRCGPYDHRPAACRSYPAEISEPDSVIRVRSVARCPVGTDVPDSTWRPLVRDEQVLIDVHRLVAWRWNRHVLSTNGDYELVDYLAYLIDVHDRLNSPWDALTSRPDWPELRERWGAALDHGVSPFLDEEPTLTPWMNELRSLIGAIEASFPADPAF